MIHEGRPPDNLLFRGSAALAGQDCAELHVRRFPKVTSLTSLTCACPSFRRARMLLTTDVLVRAPRVSESTAGAFADNSFEHYHPGRSIAKTPQNIETMLFLTARPCAWLRITGKLLTLYMCMYKYIYIYIWCNNKLNTIISCLMFIMVCVVSLYVYIYIHNYSFIYFKLPL